MKKHAIIISCLIAFSANALGAEWSDFEDLDKAWDGQKTITNKEFEEVMDALQTKQKQAEEKKKKKRFKKISGGGTSLHGNLNPDKEIGEVQKLKAKKEDLLINIPVNLIIDNQILEKGYYNVVAEREEDKRIAISLYQSQYFKGKIYATETKDDYGEECIDFAKLIPYNDNFVKLIFGSLAFNAYAFMPYTDKN